MFNFKKKKKNNNHDQETSVKKEEVIGKKLQVNGKTLPVNVRSVRIPSIYIDYKIYQDKILNRGNQENLYDDGIFTNVKGRLYDINLSKFGIKNADIGYDMVGRVDYINPMRLGLLVITEVTGKDNKVYKQDIPILIDVYYRNIKEVYSKLNRENLGVNYWYNSSNHMKIYDEKNKLKSARYSNEDSEELNKLALECLVKRPSSLLTPQLVYYYLFKIDNSNSDRLKEEGEAWFTLPLGKGIKVGNIASETELSEKEFLNILKKDGSNESKKAFKRYSRLKDLDCIGIGSSKGDILVRNVNNEKGDIDVFFRVFIKTSLNELSLLEFYNFMEKLYKIIND